MSKRFGWLLGVAVLVSIGLLVACGSKYKSSSDGLVLVASQGSNLVQTFSFSLSTGHISEISGPASTPAKPFDMVLDPAGTYAFVITGASISTFKINSNGTTTAGATQADPNPVALAMDSSGKYLFVSEGPNTVFDPANPTACSGTTSQVGVCAYSIGGDGSLTPVPGTFTFTLPTGFQIPNFVALAATPTTLPPLANGQQTSVCSNPANNPPTSEYLYVADSVNNVVWEYEVDPSSGTLKNPLNQATIPPYSAGSVPSGVVVDPCDRFVYVSNMQSNQITALAICNGSSTQSSNCLTPADGRPLPIAGSPFPLSSNANGPGAMVIDPFANYLYVLDTLSNQISPFHISPVSGSLTAGTVVSTGNTPKAMAIRGDDSWLFVTNFNPPTLSEYTITPSSGALAPLPAITTDNYPWGVAVK